jgi:hypothetical protein
MDTELSLRSTVMRTIAWFWNGRRLRSAPSGVSRIDAILPGGGFQFDELSVTSA